MSEQKTAELIAVAKRYNFDGAHPVIAHLVRAWLAEHDAKVRAEALREVRDAWTRAGRMPTHHHRLKNQLRRDWPVLAGALDRIEREAR